MTKKELKNALEAHLEWLEDDKKGARFDVCGKDLMSVDLSNVDLRYANINHAYLCSANLSCANLSYADLSGTDLCSANLSNANLFGANLICADLASANLFGADLTKASLVGADLRDATIDYSSFPLWCGGLHIKMDYKQLRQLAYHFCAQDCDDPEYICARNAILDFANGFHRVNECGKLSAIPKNDECEKAYWFEHGDGITVYCSSYGHNTIEPIGHRNYCPNCGSKTEEGKM